MEHQPARSEYKKVWSALSTTEDEAKLHVIGVTEEAALQATGEETLRFLQDSVGIGREDVVLEIGCGIGRVGKVVAPLCRKWIGWDVAANMLSLTAQRLKDLPNVELVEISGYNLSSVADASVRFSRGNTYEKQTYCYHSIFNRAIALGALSFAWSAAAQSQTGSSTSLNAKDKMFVKKAAKGGMMEVAMGKLASERGQSADVKKFGERMVTDHSKGNDDLTSIAEKKEVKLPSKKPTETWTSDKDYMAAMVKDHEKDLAEFQKEAKEGTDPDIKEFAERTAKMVQEHPDLAKETQSKLQ